MPLANAEVYLTDTSGDPISGSQGLAVSGTVSIGGQVSVNNFPATQSISGSVAAFIQNWPAVHGVSASVPFPIWNTGGPQGISGTVGVNNFPATQNVSGTVTLGGQVSVNNFPATQNVSGTVGVQGVPTGIPIAVWIPGTVGISGSIVVTPGVTQTAQNVSSSSGVKVFNFAPVGVSASVALRTWDGGVQGVSGSAASPIWVTTTGSLAVTGSVVASPPLDLVTNGTLTANGTTVVAAWYGWSSLAWQITGNWTGSIFFEKSLDNVSWFTASFYDGATSNAVNFTTYSSIFYNSPGASEYYRLRALASLTGTANWTAARSVSVKGISVTDALPTGNNSIGTVVMSTTSSKASTSATSNVAGSASSQTLLAANASRSTAIIFNDSSGVLYVKLGTPASLTSFSYRLVSNATLELPFPMYTGILTGIWSLATGSARITELTP